MCPSHRSVPAQTRKTVASGDAAGGFGGWANLDVPVSVWPDSASPAALMTALTREFSPRGGLVVTTVWQGWSQILRHGRRGIAWCHRSDVAAAEAEAGDVAAPMRGLGLVRVASRESLSVRLAELSGRAEVVIGDQDVRWCEGWWPAAVHAVKPGGTIAVVIDSADASVHAGITRHATAANADYVQHIVATSASALDDAVEAPTLTRQNGRHVRVHRDIAVFTKHADTEGVEGADV